MLNIVLSLVIVFALGVVIGILCAPRDPRPCPGNHKATGFLIRQLVHLKFARLSRRLLMNITGIAPGASGVFTETPLPGGVTLPAGVIPQWTSSDPVNAPITSQAADGSSCTVTVPATANVPSFVLSVSAKLPDGTTPSANVTVPINFPEVTGFDINQTS